MTTVGQITRPGIDTFLATLKRNKAEASTDSLVSLLKRRQIRGARRCATATAHLLINIVAEYKPKDSLDLLNRIKTVGHRLNHAQPKELVVGNIVRRVLGLVREAVENSSGAKKSEDINGFVHDRQANVAAKAAEAISLPSIKEDVLDGIRELLEELEQADRQIADYSNEHIHSGEIILSYTSSLTIQIYLIDAAKRRKFTVIQVEGYPHSLQQTHETMLRGARKGYTQDDDGSNRLKSLAAAGIDVICVPDSAVCSLMPRVNKVILPAQGILSDGSFVSCAGSRVIARAAKLHRIPVIVLGAIYRLSPAFPFEPDDLVDFGQMEEIFPYEDSGAVENIQFVNPTQELVPSDLVSLFNTNIGSHAPAFMYRIAADHYRLEDVELRAPTLSQQPFRLK